MQVNKWLASSWQGLVNSTAFRPIERTRRTRLFYAFHAPSDTNHPSPDTSNKPIPRKSMCAGIAVIAPDSISLEWQYLERRQRTLKKEIVTWRMGMLTSLDTMYACCKRQRIAGSHYWHWLEAFSSHQRYLYFLFQSLCVSAYFNQCGYPFVCACACTLQLLDTLISTIEGWMSLSQLSRTPSSELYKYESILNTFWWL